MRDFVLNFQPTIFALLGVIILLVFPTKIDEARLEKINNFTHVKMRIAWWIISVLIISFLFSALLAPKSYLWANTLCVFVLFLIYGVKVYLAIQKANQSKKLD